VLVARDERGVNGADVSRFAKRVDFGVCRWIDESPTPDQDDFTRRAIYLRRRRRRFPFCIFRSRFINAFAALLPFTIRAGRERERRTFRERFLFGRYRGPVPLRA